MSRLPWQGDILGGKVKRMRETDAGVGWGPFPMILRRKSRKRDRELSIRGGRRLNALSRP